NPAAEVFAGGVFKAFDFVEIAMVKGVVSGFESRLDIGKIHDPAAGFTSRTADIERNGERVAVESAALVTFGHIGQVVGGLKGKFLEYFHSCRSKGFNLRLYV